MIIIRRRRINDWSWRPGKPINVLLVLVIATSSSAAGLFEENTIIAAELHGPISELIKNKKDREEHQFTISVDNVDIRLKVRARGNSRMKVCDFPPLRFNFPSKATKGSLFEYQNRLKLVTHCTEKKRDAGNVFDEYLAYRIFNLLSDASYRVRLLQLTYSDTDKSRTTTPLQRYAFLIESDKALAKRIGAEPADVGGIVYSRLDDDQAALVYVFHYLIGNTDWSLVTATTDDFCCHNGDILDVDGQHVLVPYDFDLAGLVNASYAKPDSSIRIRSVKSRRYRGYCTSADTVRNALRAIIDLKPSILDVAESVPSLSPKALADRTQYLDEFFDKAADEDKLLRSFERRCL